MIFVKPQRRNERAEDSEKSNRSDEHRRVAGRELEPVRDAERADDSEQPYRERAQQNS